jgi:transcriptional regulator with XRE-family HTH domain
MTSQTNKYPNHLYRLRRIRGLSQKALAHLLGRTVRMVSRYETGVALPPLKTAFMLQIALGAHVSDIFPDAFHELERLAAQRSSQLRPVLGRHIRDRHRERTKIDSSHP